MESTVGISGRLRAAMTVAGIFSLDELASKARVPIEELEALAEDDPSRLSAASSVKLNNTLRVASRWLLLSEGPPARATHLTPDESWVINLYRSLSERDREVVHHLLKNLVA